MNQSLSKSNKSLLFESSLSSFLSPSSTVSCFYITHPAHIKVTPHLRRPQKAASVQPPTSKEGKHGSAVNVPTRLVFTSATRLEFTISRARQQRRNRGEKEPLSANSKRQEAGVFTPRSIPPFPNIRDLNKYVCNLLVNNTKYLPDGNTFNW